ncbi:hypothetical protein Scep_001335 [Stephania cephalantha]|uniref:DUF7026 domain-containing protein n=1 Tax=Stephania cephalantha TaxID=152367 RepID=A0AAP0LBK3_9MAGN
MALRLPLFTPPIAPTNTHNRHRLLPSQIPHKTPKKFNLSCTANTNNDNRASEADLAVDLASEVSKMKAQMVQRKEAMEKSREALFGELCAYLGMREEEMRGRWRKMGEEEKLSWANNFVSNSEWGEAFRPLSSKSVKELVEEHLASQRSSSISISSSSSSSDPSFSSVFGISGLKRLLGFLENNK